MAKSVSVSPIGDMADSKLGFQDSFRGYVQDKLLVVEYIMIDSMPALEFNSGVVNNFSDSFEPQWTEKTTVGRMDPIGAYKTTVRKITTGLTLIAEGKTVAARNLAQASKMARFTYPSYANSTRGTTSMQGPFVRLKLMNWITDTSTGSGLQGYLLNVNINFDFNEGAFHDGGNTYPKYINLDFQFNVVHTSNLGYTVAGYKQNQEPNFGEFPYGVTIDKATPSGNIDGVKAENKENDTSDSGQTAQQVNDAVNADNNSKVLKT